MGWGVKVILFVVDCPIQRHWGCLRHKQIYLPAIDTLVTGMYKKVVCDKMKPILKKRYSDAMVCKSIPWVHVSSEVWWWVLFGRFHKNLEVSKYSINALKAPQMVTLGKISCCGGILGATGPGWLVYKKNSRDQNTVYLENFEAKAHDLVTSNGRYVVVGRCWVLLALVGCSLLKPPQPTSATTRLLGVGLLRPGHGRPPISSSGWTSWTTTCGWTT